MSDTVLFARDIGGLGDLLMTLPAVRRYKQRGWQTVYYWPQKWLAWGELCPWIDILIPAFFKDTRNEDENGMAIMEPSRRLWIRNILQEAHLSPAIADDIALFIDFSWPEQNLEEAALASGSYPPLNRVELFWCHAHLPLPELPEMPMPGLLQDMDGFKDSRLDDMDYCVIQAESGETNWKPFAPDMIRETLNTRLRRHDFQNVVVAATHWPAVRQWTKWDVLGAVDLAAPEVYTLVRDAQVVFTPDSALLHLAAITETPAEAWFTVTNGPLTCRRYPQTRVHQGKCLPCYRHKAWMKADCWEKQRCLP